MVSGEVVGGAGAVVVGFVAGELHGAVVDAVLDVVVDEVVDRVVDRVVDGVVDSDVVLGAGISNLPGRNKQYIRSYMIYIFMCRKLCTMKFCYFSKVVPAH